MSSSPSNGHVEQKLSSAGSASSPAPAHKKKRGNAKYVGTLQSKLGPRYTFYDISHPHRPIGPNTPRIPKDTTLSNRILTQFNL
jgi:hypothetical protein